MTRERRMGGNDVCVEGHTYPSSDAIHRGRDFFRVTIPAPPPQLSPNHYVGSRGGRLRRARLTKAYRQTVGLLAHQALDGQPPPRWNSATARAVFVVNTQRRRDGDNALASLKAAWDALRDAGIIEDDSGLAHEPVRFIVETRADWPRGCVEIEVRGKAAPLPRSQA